MATTADVITSLPTGPSAARSCPGIGRMFEIYDFVVYGFMAGAGGPSFPEDPIAAAERSHLAVGFVMRPSAPVISAYGTPPRARALVDDQPEVATGVIH